AAGRRARHDLQPGRCCELSRRARGWLRAPLARVPRRTRLAPAPPLMKPGVLVVGGGIGGLSLARELTLRGLPVTVLEKAPKLEAVGSGIIINPNAMAVLEANGLAT